MVSCNSDTVTITAEEYKQLKGDTIKPEYPREVHWTNHHGLPTYGHIIKIENHEYFCGYGIQTSHSFFMMHYPDCKFCKHDTLK